MTNTGSTTASNRIRLRRRAVWIAAAIAVLTIIWLAGGFDWEPRYQGKLASAWFTEMSQPFPQPAEAAFKAMGTNALPFLIRTIKKEPSSIALRFLSFANRHDFLQWVTRWLPNEVRIHNNRGIAINLIGRLGPDAALALPALKTMAKSTNGFEVLSWETAWKIDRNTNFALGILTNWMATSNLVGNARGLQELALMGPAGKPLEGLLMDAVADQNEIIRNLAEEALSQVDSNALNELKQQLNEHVVENTARLLSAIRQGGDKAKWEALQALAAIGPESHTAVETLVEVLRDPTEAPRNKMAAAEALGEFGPEAQPAISELIAMNQRQPHYPDWPCLLPALGRFGRDAEAAVPMLIQLLAEKKPLKNEELSGYPSVSASFLAAEAMSRIAPEKSSNAIPVLQEASESTEESLRLRAQVALWRCHVLSEPPLIWLTAIIERRRSSTSHWSILTIKSLIELLGDIGPPARMALPLLERELAPNSYFRHAAAIAIRRIDPDEARRIGLPGLLALP